MRAANQTTGRRGQNDDDVVLRPMVATVAWLRVRVQQEGAGVEDLREFDRAAARCAARAWKQGR